MKYYTEPIDKVYENLKSSENGLNKKEVEERLKQYGKNELPTKKSDSVITIFFRQLIDPIVLLLVVAMLFSFFINEKIDGFAILFIITVDMILGTFQEWKANKNAQALSKLIQVKSEVLREKQDTEINSCDLVPGDIVLLDSGDKISADLRIISSSNLTVDESILTGESINVEKSAHILEEDTPLSERSNMLYAGTNVITGRATAIVVATGINTEIGKIATTVATTKETKSPLTIRMEKFSKQISLLIIVVAIIIAVLLYVKKVPGNEIFLSVIALSVSAMPEGLPLALTMALTIASNKMSKKKVVVKKLNSVESLGSCTVIASDKTGTLTVNEQTAKMILFPNNDEFLIEGTGYNDKGKVLPQNKAKIEDAIYISTLGVLNNEAHLEKRNNTFEKIGDSIDIAFLALGKKLKIETKDYNIIKTIPYESKNKYSAVFYENNNKKYLTAKGSVEKILSFSTNMKIGNKEVPIDEQLIKNQNELLASKGYRVIAIAEKTLAPNSNDSIEKLTFIGLVAFIDPIRKEAKKAVEECNSAGIKVVMITGDHPLTALAIAKELNIASTLKEVATSKEVDEYLKKGQKAFDNFVKTKKVFTRVTPINKLEIVESFKRQGEFIAVTGDGVNDAPALKAANIGIAMGSGTDVAKETASMIIFDDNFSSIVTGIKEGRNAYSNIRKVSYMLLSCGVAEVLFFILSVILNLPMPLVAVQLLWLNIVTDGLQDFALSFEKAEKDIMKEPPRDPKESIFNKDLLTEVLLSGLTIGLTVFILWYYLIKVANFEVSSARGYIMMLMVFMQNMHVLNCRSEKSSAFKVSLKTNYLIVFSIISAIILQLIIGEVDTFSKFLQTTSVPVLDTILLFMISTIIIIVMETYKYVKKNKES